MFEQKYEDRLVNWSDLRQRLETSVNPYQEVNDFYNNAPYVSIHVDPWNQASWPTPWELLFENQYCEFSCVLGQCYSLQLTDRFKDDDFEIHIGIDNKKSETYYLLIINKTTIIGWSDPSVDYDALPKTYIPQRIYSMPPLQ
jgi:hypothetical protein